MKNKFRNYLPAKLPRLLIFMLISSLILFYWSCQKDDFDFNKLANPSWNPEFALPLVNSSFTIFDFYKDSSNLIIKTNADNSISFVYQIDDLYSVQANDFLKIPDQTFGFDDEIDVPPLPPGFLDTITLDYSYDLITDSLYQRIDSVFLKDGEITIEGFTNLNKDDALINVCVQSLINKQTGDPLVIVADISNHGGALPEVSFLEHILLNEYKIVPGNLSGNRNEISFIIEIFIKGDDNPDLSPYDINISGTMGNFSFEKIFGYFGNYEFPFRDSLKISLFDKTISGNLQLGPQSVDLFIDIDNSYGMPMMFLADEFYAYSSFNEPHIVNIELFGSGIPNIFSINSPDINQIGQTVKTELAFNQSNIADALNISPEVLYFDLKGISNPYGDTLTSNFVLDTSKIELGVAAEIELFSAVSGFVINDTLTFDLDENEEVEALQFRLNSWNGFPIDAKLQMIFMDENFNVIDSLFTNPEEAILLGGYVNGPPQYRVTEPRFHQKDIVVNEQKLDNILSSENVFLRAKLSTTDGTLVKIYEDYELKIKIGVIVKLKIENN